MIALRSLVDLDAIKYVIAVLTFCYPKVYGQGVFRLLQTCEREATVAGFLPTSLFTGLLKLWIWRWRNWPIARYWTGYVYFT